MLRRLRPPHGLHYLALHDGSPEALARSSEYCFKAWRAPFTLAPRESTRFWIQTARALFSRLPVMVARKQSAGARRMIKELLSAETFDVAVCGFFTPLVNLPPSLPFCLFEHTRGTVHWRRST